MRKYCFLLIMLFTAKLMYGQQYPWCQDSIAIVLDIGSQNKIEWDKARNDPRLTGIIHRAGDGTQIDSMYRKRKDSAKAVGLLWGAYHMFTNQIPLKEQVRKYIEVISPIEGDDLVSLNFEHPSKKKYQIPLKDIFEAIRFFYDTTHRYPMVYFGRSYLKDIIVPYIQKQPETIRKDLIQLLSNCILWCPAIDPKTSPNLVLEKLPVRLWNSYTLWQFGETDFCKKGANGAIRYCDCSKPYSGKCCLYPTNDIWSEGSDLNVYKSTVKDIREKWPLLK